jgi:hypothetical protein
MVLLVQNKKKLKPSEILIKIITDEKLGNLSSPFEQKYNLDNIKNNSDSIIFLNLVEKNSLPNAEINKILGSPNLVSIIGSSGIYQNSYGLSFNTQNKDIGNIAMAKFEILSQNNKTFIFATIFAIDTQNNIIDFFGGIQKFDKFNNPLFILVKPLTMNHIFFRQINQETLLYKMNMLEGVLENFL